MADEDQRAAREADVAGGDRRATERGGGSNDSRHEQIDSCICSGGIRFLRSGAGARGPSRGGSSWRHGRGEAKKRGIGRIDTHFSNWGLHKGLHTHRTLEVVQVQPKGKVALCRSFAEPSDGLEPSTPSLPWR